MAISGHAERPEADPPILRTLSDVRFGDTCHIDVIDRWGNVASATPSGGWLHDSSVVPGLGFGMNTRAQMCWLDESSPSRLEPLRRPRTTLSPTIVITDGDDVQTFGGRGADMQDQWLAQYYVA